jgi:Protein of unknown function (DUF2892)
MQLGKLLTYSFDHNVGSVDRLFRIVSGAALAAAPFVFFPIDGPIRYLMLAAGLAWLMTGIVSRCGMYYMFGFSSCPVDPRK